MIDIFQYFWTPKLGEKRRDGHSWDKNFKTFGPFKLEKEQR